MSAAWLVITKASKARSRARIVEDRLKTYLLADLDAAHVLTGEHGRRVLTEFAERWNASQYETSHNFTRCRADYLTESARKSFTLSLTK